jgi:hypothetical protein
MPPRWACVLIVLCWLAVNGWLFYHELLPRLLPDQPPPYSVDLLEEVQDRRWMRPVGWTVYVRGEEGLERALSAKMRVDHPARDTFEMVAEYTPLKGEKYAPPLRGLEVEKMTSTYRVNAAGDLLGVSFELEGRPKSEIFKRWLPGRFVLDIRGDVEGEQFKPVGRLRLPAAGVEQSQSLPGAVVRRGGGVLLPLHPVNRLRGLRPGQTWTVAVFDPVVDAMRNFGGESELRRLRCRVRDEEEIFSHGRRNNVPCLVIDMEGEGLTGRTLVARDTGLVLAQEIASSKKDQDRTALYRD